MMADDPEWAKDIFDTEAEMAIRVLDHLEQSGVAVRRRLDVRRYRLQPCALLFAAHVSRADQARPCAADCVVQGTRVARHLSHRRRFPPILIPDLIDTGVDCFQPLEAKAHMDLRELKPLYGERVTFMGNIDIMVLITNDRARIEAEVAAKIPLAKQGGGYIYHSDHSIPPGVTWETYQFLMQLIDHYGRY